MDFFGCQNGKADAGINSKSTGWVSISHEIRSWVQNFGNGMTFTEKFCGSCKNHSCGLVRKYKIYSFVESRRACLAEDGPLRSRECEAGESRRAKCLISSAA